MGGTRYTLRRAEMCIQNSVVNTERMRPLGRPRRRLENNITNILKK
jgi:hypothetical protein